MKNFINKAGLLFCFLGLASCNDFLDREPISSVSPEKYLTDESHLAAYSVNMYGLFRVPGIEDYAFKYDVDTDNQAYLSENSIYVPDNYRVPENGGAWDFGTLYQCNYFFDRVLPLYESNKITGNMDNIKHYIGEMYFFRAYAYFNCLMNVGDYPIITTVLPDDDKNALIEASKRKPRNEVARFILSDLQHAIEMMLPNSIDGNKNRLSRYCAYLLKSRVALYEASWLRYFKNTAFVPNGEGWPGAEMPELSNYQYPSGNIDKEIDFFYEQAIAASDAVASQFQLTENTGLVRQDASEPENPYMEMFSSEDMSKFDEVLLWKKYDNGLRIYHNTTVCCRGNQGTGLTRGMVDNYVMSNGYPSYDPEAHYSDETLHDVRKDRDNRLFVFLKEPGQKNLLTNKDLATHAVEVEGMPEMTGAYRSSTGYHIRKGCSTDGVQFINGQGTTGYIVFRAAEAYLNYIEAYYERYHNLDAKALAYWQEIRKRAKLPVDPYVTINRTDISKEALSDWAAYSGGQLLTDKVLYNIRRERRCEFLGEGLRFMDLKRWRSMDQMIGTPYFIEGMKIWGEMQEYYKDDSGNSILKYGTDDANVSSPELSKYMRPYQILKNSLAYNGYRWKMAHYLNPIASKHFMLASPSNDYDGSVIYQNPGWSKVPNTVAEF